MRFTKNIDKKTKKDTDKPKKQLKNIQVNDRLVDKNNNPYFFKNSKSNKNIIAKETLELSIYLTDNIFTSLSWDTEYTQPVGNLNKLTIEELAKNPNKQLLQLENIDKTLSQLEDLKGIYEASKKQRREIVDASILNKNIERIKQQPTLHLTTQFKHVLYNDAEILLNPKIKTFYENQVKQSEYLYPYYDLQSCHFIDFLRLKGFTDCSIERFNNRDDFLAVQKNMLNTKKSKLPTLTIKLFGFYSLADLCKSFGGDYLLDIIQAIKMGKITQKRRLTASGWQKAWYTNWLIKFNGLQYCLALDFVDLGGIHGIVSYETILENLSIQTEDKNLLNDLKDNMLFAMVSRPKDFKKYAISDLYHYEVFQKHNELIKSVYKELGVEDKFVESKLTTGAFTNDLQEVVLLKKLNYNNEELQNIVDEYNSTHKKKKTIHTLTAKDLLKPFTYTASPQYLKSYYNVNLKNSANLKKHTTSKTMGGRCYNNRMTNNIKSKNFDICDIDISGAYSTIYNSLNYYYGSPVILNFIQYKVTLRELLKYYRNNLSKRDFKLVVETKKDLPLTIEQDIFCSWTNLTYRHKAEKISGTDDQWQQLSSVDLTATNNDIFTTELHNATLTWDDIDCIQNELKKEQREELLDKLYIVSTIFYPKSMQCHSIEELKEKIIEHKQNGKYTFNDAMPHSSIDNEAINSCNYWYAVNFGEIIGEIIKLARARHKKSNKSLSYLFKLIANTLYGINVSQYFYTSNIVLAANITAMCRMGMWYTEKALNIYQTITDGGIFKLNKVSHLIYNKIDTTCLVRAYQSNARELANNDKWTTKPITKNGKEIEYHQDKGWLIDNLYFGCDVDKLLEAEKIYKDLKTIEKKDSLKLIDAENTFNNYQNEMSKLHKKINDLSMEHVQKTFSRNALLNDIYKHYKTNDVGDIIFNEYEKAEYEMKKGLFSFEMKTLTKEVSFHGSADYFFTDYRKENKLKMRGYESKKSTIAWSLDENNNLKHDQNYYKKTLAIEMFLKNIQDNPTKVEILKPFTKPSILKIKQYNSQHKKTFQYSTLKPGDEYYEVVMIPILTMRFKFKSLEQKKNWTRYFTSLKNRYGGLSFEIFYMNDDNTVNYEKMMKEIDQHISNGIMNPKSIYDPYNHLKRDYNNPYVLKHVELMRQLKNCFRLNIVGISQYCKENFIIKDKLNNIALIPTPMNYTHSEITHNYEDVTKYSSTMEYRDYGNNSINTE